MRRWLPMMVGVVLVLAAGAAHGLWTQRWGPTPELQAAAQRLERHTPGDLGPWRASPAEPPPAAVLREAGVEFAWSAVYRHRYSRASAQVLVLCGRAGPLTKHRPEHCYPGAGYEMTAGPEALSVTPPDAPVAVFRTALFTRHEVAQDTRLRIFWSWYARDSWQAPESPRWAFAGQSSLVKLYVLRELPPGPPEKPADDPTADLLQRLAPELSRILRAE